VKILSEPTPELKAFARTASGLTRAASAWDTFVMNINTIGILHFMVFATWGAALYIGLDLPLSVIPSLAISIPIAVLYLYLSVAMPRTGGDYIWVSRILHPGLAFMCSLLYCVLFLSWMGLEPAWCLQWGIAPILHGIGVLNNDPNLMNLAVQIASPAAVQIAGFFYFIAVALVLVGGAKRVIKAQWVMFITIVIGTVVFFAVTLSTSSSAFTQRFESMTGTSVAQFVDSAVAEGYVKQMTLSGTVFGTVYSLMNMIGYYNSVYFAGEVKDVRKSQLTAIIGSLFIFAFIMCAGYAALYYSMGKDFFGAISYLFVMGSNNYTLSFPGYPQFFLAYFTSNPIAIILICLGFALAPLGVGLSVAFSVTRNMFAWSFDRVVPTKLSTLDRRFNSPYLILIIVVILGMISQVLWLYTNILGYLAYGMTGFFLCCAVTGIAGAVFPYRRKDMFNAAPETVRKRIGGVPIISIAGVLTFIVSIFIAYATLTPTFAGAFNPDYLAVIVGTFAAGLAIYSASWVYHRKKISLDLTFKAIPPE
jgi:amino acid transporter